MILRSIQVQNWRCFIDPVTVGPFSEQLNVLHAPNATGKTTLFEALRRALLDGHRVTGREVESIRPWGRALAPTVTVEFAHDGISYRVTKRFLDNPSAILEREENGRFVPLAEGGAADEQARGILSRNPPGRGLARPENWGLAQILWAPQGDLSYTRLSGDLLADIRTSLGAQVTGPGVGPVEKRIEEAYLQFFTPSGRIRSGKDAPRLSALKKQLEDALERRAAAISQQQAYEEAVRRVEDLRARQAQAKHDAEVINKALEEARSRAELYNKLLFEKKQRQLRLKTAEAQYNELKQRIDTIKELREEIQGIEESIAKLKSDLPLKQQEVEIRWKEAADAKAALEDARKGRQAVDDAIELSEQARRFLENERALSELNQLIARIKTAEESLNQLKRERAELVAPDAQVLRAIRRAIKERDEAQVRIDVALITLEMVPEKESALTIVAGEKPGALKLHPGLPVEIKGSPEVVVDLTGFGRVRASGPPGSIEEHRERKAQAVQRLKELTEPFATIELAQLEDLNEQAVVLEKKVSETETQLETLLAGRRLEDIENERSKHKLALEKVLRQHPSWDRKRPDVAALETEAQNIKRSFIENVESAEAAWEAAQSAFTMAKNEETGLAGRLEDLRKQFKSVESKLARITSDGKDDLTRAEELKNLALSWEAAKVSLEEIEDKLSYFDDDPLAAVTKLTKQLNAADEAATNALAKEKNAEGMLNQISAQGTYSNLALIEEEVAKLQSEIESEELHMLGIRLVYETLSECRAEAVAGIVGPVEKMATKTLQRVAGRRLGCLKVGENFEPVNVIPEISESSVSLDSVSGGEKEQIYLATRLALAEVIAKNERQLVVLDDVLTFTDAGRLARVMNILEEAAQKLQILVLTCHPERYRGLEAAHFIDLEAMLRPGQ
ncbi:MAG: AAA family ATPase [Deltaproteobacteria bacterium]|nr:AAA family ATPase [Deltaproteobacteria bacterium]